MRASHSRTGATLKFPHLTPKLSSRLDQASNRLATPRILNTPCQENMMLRWPLLAASTVGALMLGGCGLFVSKTDEVAQKDAVPVPANRILAYQEQAPRTGAVTVVRDLGAHNKTCTLVVQANGKFVAALQPGESVTFHLPAGPNEVGTGHDPKWSGGCEVLAWKAPVLNTYEIEPGKAMAFRLSSRSYRRPALEPASLP